MIRTVRNSGKARQVAFSAINSFLLSEFLNGSVSPIKLELGVLPVFALSTDHAATFDVEKSYRVGWRFICLKADSEMGAIINIRRSRWRKPQFIGYSIGRKAFRHLEIAREAFEWAAIHPSAFVARIVIVPQINIDLLWLKPFGKIEKSRFFLLSSRGKRSREVSQFVIDKANIWISRASKSNI